MTFELCFISHLFCAHHECSKKTSSSYATALMSPSVTTDTNTGKLVNSRDTTPKFSPICKHTRSALAQRALPQAASADVLPTISPVLDSPNPKTTTPLYQMAASFSDRRPASLKKIPSSINFVTPLYGASSKSSVTHRISSSAPVYTNASSPPSDETPLVSRQVPDASSSSVPATPSCEQHNILAAFHDPLAFPSGNGNANGFLS